MNMIEINFAHKYTRALCLHTWSLVLFVSIPLHTVRHVYNLN